jgi:opacity protein-like surface antigen
MISAKSECDGSVAMRRFLLVAVMFGVAASAQAADMPDFLRGGFAPAPAPRAIWQGYYVGGQAEYGSITSKLPASINDDLQSTFIPPPSIPGGQFYNWRGLGPAHENNSGYGGFAGYNSQWDDVVVGVEANYMHSQFRPTASSVGYTYFPDLTVRTIANSSASMQLTDFGSMRIRAGYVVGSFLPYLFGGAGVGSSTVERNISASPAPLFTPQLQSSAVKSKLVYGYSFGAGVDVMLMAGLFLRAEYEYQRVTSTIESNINTVRAGVGYKF